MRILPGLLLLGCLWVADARASETYWTENAGLTVRFALPSGEGSCLPPANPSEREMETQRSGEVFDSPDFQRMLLLPARWDRAYVLDLGTGAVTRYPQAAVIAPEGVLRSPAPEEGMPAGSFRIEADGSISFMTEDCVAAVGPAGPLVGRLERAELEFRMPVYGRRAKLYQADRQAVSAIAAQTTPLEILAFFGTWCQSCKRVLPALFESLDEAANPQLALTLVGVDEDMAEPLDLLVGHGVAEIPTILVLRDGAEIGRIEEEPPTSVEAALAVILRAASQP